MTLNIYKRRRSRTRLSRAVLVTVVLLASDASAQNPPTGWSASDIGSPGVAGSETSSGPDSGTLTGAGTDIWGSSDQFRFAYRAVTGDVDVVVRVAHLRWTHEWAKAGVMVRGSLGATSAHGSMLVTAGSGPAFQRRPTAGAPSLHTSGGSGQAPMWVKLERRGTTVRGYRSSNGTTWTLVGTDTIAVGATVYVGLAVTSHNSATATTATFSNVSVTAPSSAPANQPPAVSLTSPAAGASFLAPASVALAATASDADGTIARVDFYAGSTLIGTDTTSPYSRSWSNVSAGIYSLTAVARDNAGATTVSGARSITVRDPATPTQAVFTPSGNHATAVDRYVVEFFFAGSNPSVSNPVATADIGRPSVVSGEIRADVSQTITSLTPGAYIATVTAIGGGGSARSAPSPPFTR